mmetsp:Transcript_25293/g.66135  ORF Transcript_25293/g.66135 Transcript_25293/m.66135 type:complete len:495 (-) Transcript_25293:1335-2819(-)
MASAGLGTRRLHPRRGKAGGRGGPTDGTTAAAAASDQREECCWATITVLGSLGGVALSWLLIQQVLLSATGGIDRPLPAPAPPPPPPPRVGVNIVRLPRPNVDYTQFTTSPEPVVLRNSVVEQWTAYRDWTPEYLAERLPQVRVYTQDKPEFITWHDDKQLEPHVAAAAGSRAAFNTMHNVSTTTVLHSAGPPHHYFSLDVLQLQQAFPQVVRDLQPLRPLAPADTGLQVNLWMGAKGVQTYMHFDASYNAFAQLHGRKRFTLFPPNASMYPWPCLHPHIGHAQVDWRGGHSQTRFPRFNPAAAVSVEVGRGDLLILPPYWWHHVETTASPSISVNVWSDAPAYSLLDQAYTIALPLEAEWTVAVRAATAMVFVRRVVDSVLDGRRGGLAAFASELYHHRWERIVATGHLDVPTTSELGAACRAAVSVAVPPQADARKIDERAAAVRRKLAAIEPETVRLLSLGNYVERVAAAAVGADATAEFIADCLARGDGG